MSKTILAVDDSNSMRQMVCHTLRAAGYDVTEAADGAEGLAKAQDKTFQLILTDLHMPRMDGISLIKSLRGLPQYRSIPTLMLTTEASPELKDKGRAAGATGWMIKPFDPIKLVELVKKVIG